MKKAFAIALTLLAIVSARQARADVCLDAFGVMADNGDEKIQHGGGLSLAWDVLRRFDIGNTFLIVSAYASTGIEDRETPTETSRISAVALAGVQYRQPVSSLPLFITASALAGSAYLTRSEPAHYGPYIDPSETDTIDAFGFAASFRLGVLAVCTQRISLFAECGYGAYLMGGDYGDESIGGWQAFAGARFTISGRNRRLWDE